jgi:hypothetical protein
VTEPVAAAPSRRFLFVMQYPGYLRYFDSTVRALTARGHHVDIAFDSPRKQAEGVEALDAVAGVEIIGRTAGRDDVWGAIAPGLRGTVDYLRYLHPRFADATYLRNRMRVALPPLLRPLGRWRTASRALTRRLVHACLACERAVPSSAAIEQFIRARRPDAVLVTPLVTDRCSQVDVVKSAQALGIPTALCVASWDHLTTKGLIRVQPDLVAVWNEEQKREALEFHDTPAERIVVTGAQPFDKWFTRRPTPRGEFCRRVGLAADRPFILFVGSTASISAPDAELRFVRRWIDAVRAHADLADVGILIRPHPYNAAHWAAVDLSDLPNVAIYPRAANPVNESDRQDYFDSLHHSEAVIGVNTTAMIEAAIAGRTVHTVLVDDFKDTQGGTLHFQYLLTEKGGFLRVARRLDEHAAQLAETLRNPQQYRGACQRFVSTFIRPYGLDEAATPRLVAALEQVAATPAARVTVPPYLYPLRAFLWLLASMAAWRDPRRSARRPVPGGDTPKLRRTIG